MFHDTTQRSFVGGVCGWFLGDLGGRGKSNDLRPDFSIHPEFFVKENPTFERSLFPRLELYTKSRNASIRWEVEGLPDVQCPEIDKDIYRTVCPTASVEPLDRDKQFMLYIENLLQMESHQPYISFSARDISTA